MEMRFDATSLFQEREGDHNLPNVEMADWPIQFIDRP
jgi:hypothetical protein